jgi:phage shock protein A
MASRLKHTLSNTLRYVIAARETDLSAIEDTFRNYAIMLDILADTVEREAVGSDVVRLQGLAYEQIRLTTGLPSQMVLLGIRDFAARRSSGEQLPGIPLDEKLYAIKGPSALTVSTVRGRISVHYDVAGYLDGWRGSAPARLVPTNSGFEIHAGVKPSVLPGEEKTMSYEGFVSRAGRMIAGLAHATLDTLAESARLPVVEQAIREIDREAENVRTELGKHTAEQHRIETRRNEVQKEIDELTPKIVTAIEASRDDLARAGVERQMDLESQIAALDVAWSDIDEKMGEARSGIQAILAAKREAEARRDELKRSLVDSTTKASFLASAGKAPTAQERALRSLEAISRVTGVPVDSAPLKASEMDELERLHRDKTVEDRLAALKSKGSI